MRSQKYEFKSYFTIESNKSVELWRLEIPICFIKKTATFITLHLLSFLENRRHLRVSGRVTDKNERVPAA